MAPCCTDVHGHVSPTPTDGRNQIILFFSGRICQCVVQFRAKHIDALYSFLYIRRKWLILRTSKKLILCRMYQNVSGPILKY